MIRGYFLGRTLSFDKEVNLFMMRNEFWDVFTPIWRLFHPQRHFHSHVWVNLRTNFMF